MKNPEIRCGGALVVAALLVCSTSGELLAQVDRHWEEPADGSWTDGLNWTGGVVPQTVDSVFIDAVGGPYVVSLGSAQTIANFTMSAPSAGAVLRLNGGAVLSITGDYLQQANAIEGSANAAVNVAGLATLRNTQLLNLPAFNASGSLSIEGTGNTLISNTSINLISAEGFWQDAGTLTFAGGAGASGLNVDAASRFTITNDRTATWNNTGTRPTINNAGIFEKDGGSNISSFVGVSLNNTGTVRVASGLLRFNSVANISGGTLTGGTWRLENNTTLDLVGQSITTNRATVELNGPASNFGAFNSLQINDTAGVLRLTGGRAFITQGAFTNNGTVELGGGASLRVADNNTFTLNGGSVAGAGQSSVLVVDDSEFQGGDLSGLTLRSTGSMLIGGASDLLCEETCIDHNGLGMVWQGTGRIIAGGGTSFSFGSGSTLTFGNEQSMEWTGKGEQPTMSMNGTLVRNSPGTTTSITDVILTNNGTITVQSGTLLTNAVENLNAGTLSNGTWEVLNNATLDFDGPTVTTNEATVILDGANATFNAINALTTNGSNGVLTLKNGKTFATQGNFTNNGHVSVEGTTGPALFKVATGSTLTNYDPETRTLNGGSFAAVGAGRDSATIEIDGLDIATLDGSVTLDGAGASIVDPVAAGDQNALRNLELIDNAGALTVTNGKNFDTLADLTVAPSGQLMAGPDSTFTVNGDLANFDSAGRFSGGAFTVGGALRADNANLVTLANSLTLDGDGRIERPDPAGGFIDALPTLTTLESTARLTLRNGHALTLAAHDLTTAKGSVVTIGPAAAELGDTLFHTQGTFNLGGSLLLDDGLIRVDENFNSTGAIRGSGAIDLPGGQLLTSSGSIEPGNATGILSITGGGDLLMTDLGEIIIDIAGLKPGSGYDQLLIDGELLFENGEAGRLAVIVDPTFTLLPGQRFEILHFGGGFDGWFAELDISDQFRQIRESDRFVLEVIPTPGAGGVLLLAGVLALRRRR